MEMSWELSLDPSSHKWMFPKIVVFPEKWMVKIVENPMNKWMIWEVFQPPIFGNTHITLGILDASS